MAGGVEEELRVGSHILCVPHDSLPLVEVLKTFVSHISDQLLVHFLLHVQKRLPIAIINAPLSLTALDVLSQLVEVSECFHVVTLLHMEQGIPEL